MKKIIPVLLFLFMSQVVFSATLSSAYEFEGNLNDSLINNTDPVLVTGTKGYGEGSVINGEFVFGFGQGLEMTNGMVDIDNYSIELLFKFDTVSGYRNIFDPGTPRSDASLYVFNSNLRWYPETYDSSSSYFTANVYHHVVMTRASDGTVYGYVDGIKRIDAINAGTNTQATGNVVHFFEDNATTEMSAGAAKYIRIYDGVLTETEVSQLFQSMDEPIIQIPEPANLLILSMIGFITIFYKKIK